MPRLTIWKPDDYSRKDTPTEHEYLQEVKCDLGINATKEGICVRFTVPNCRAILFGELYLKSWQAEKLAYDIDKLLEAYEPDRKVPEEP